MNVKEATKKLLDKGFVKLNQVGSHIKYGKGNARITIVMHRSPKEQLSRKTVKELEQLLSKN